MKIIIKTIEDCLLFFFINFSFQMFIFRSFVLNRSTSRIILQYHSYLFRSLTWRNCQFSIHLSSKFLQSRIQYHCPHAFNSFDQSKIDRLWTIPNILTFIRIGTSPILGYLIINHHYSIALSLFIISSLTDLIDGWIARHYPTQSSALGSFLDPFADKMLVGFVVISLAYVNLIPLWLLGLILSRDIAIMCVAAYLRVKSVSSPRTLKKILDMKNATVQLYPTFLSKVCDSLIKIEFKLVGKRKQKVLEVTFNTKINRM